MTSLTCVLQLMSVPNLASFKISVLQEMYRFSLPLLSFSFPLYPLGIPELQKLDEETSCEWLMVGTCLRGTVEMNEWVNRTLSFQRQLALDTPINAVQFLGSHNSFNNKADG